MKEISISNDAHQSHVFVYEDKKIEIEVRYLTTVELWYIDVLVDDTIILKGVSLSCGVPMLNQNNTPFGFYLQDNSTLGIDAFNLDDFSNGRITLYLLEREDLIELRGYDVR